MRETLRAAFVIARRDFMAVILSKAFIFFLIGPLFPIVIGGAAGAIGSTAHRNMGPPQLGVAMTQSDLSRLLAADRALEGKLGNDSPRLVVLETLAPGAAFDARGALRSGNLAAVLTGSLEAPVLTGPAERVKRWSGKISVIAGRAAAADPDDLPGVRTDPVNTSAASVKSGQMVTAQAAQLGLFLLTVMLAGMVLSNLVEEKGNKIIEVLAAAIPMDALFLGKLFAMLAVSLVAIAVWAASWGVLVSIGGQPIPGIPVPAVGWPGFLLLAFLYFAMAYLLLGSAFLTIGGMANTVREVQTLSMPVTMGQLMVFFLASYALTQTGTVVEWLAIALPFSSPYAMLARAAQNSELWPHALALAWQALWVFLIIRGGAHLFRRTVMKSGPARGAPRSSAIRKALGRLTGTSRQKCPVKAAVDVPH